MFIPTLSNATLALQYMLSHPPEKRRPPEPVGGPPRDAADRRATEPEERPAAPRAFCRCLAAD